MKMARKFMPSAGMTGGARFSAAFGFVLLLAGCTSSDLPLAKSAPLPDSADALVRPPWEAYVKAGPGAENDIDLETLNGPQAAAIAPTPPPVLPKAQKTAAKPGSVQIKAVAVLSVTGGDAVGDKELTLAMRKVLTGAGWPVLTAKRVDALTIQGTLTVDPAQNGQQLVHLVWLVLTPAGKSLGDVKQNNAVPEGSLKAGWGPNAGYATQAAADGIFKLIEKFR